MNLETSAVPPVLAVLLTCSPILAAEGTSITLARHGASEYTIVRPVDSSASQVYAAEELQSFIRQMTDAELAVTTDEQPLPAKAILLGLTRHTAAVLGEAPDMDRLGTDGFRICVRSPHIVILGSDVRGTLYGVYELLDKYGRCRWYASWHSAIPKHDIWTLPAVDETQVPAFTMREPFWWDMFQGDFAARCKANGNRMHLTEKHGGRVRFGDGLFVHTFNRLMPPAEFCEDHPEFFSEIDGKRVADHTQLCLTNPDVLRILTQRVLERMRKDPTAKLYSVSQNDWRGYCTCEHCRAIDEREGSPSGTMIHFVNQVAAEVEQEFPDAWIETLAYQYTRHPPKTLRPRHNVVPRLCSIECDFSVPLDVSTYEQNQKFVEDIRGWSAITDKLYVWDYTTNFGHYLGPHPNFASLQGNVQFFRDHKVVGLFEQGAYQGRHAEFAELRAWVLAKLLWDPDQDMEGLYRDFFTGYYGPAAQMVRTYFDELQALVAPPEHVLRLWAPMTSAWYSDEFFERAADLWDEAERLVEHDPSYSYNVRMGAMPVMYARLLRWPELRVRHVWDGDRYKPEGVDPEYARLAAELLARIHEGKCRVSESHERHTQFLTMLQARTEGFEPKRIEGGGLRAAVVPEMGGRLCMLSRQGGPNIIHAAAGGVDFADQPRLTTGTEEPPYTVAKSAQDQVLLRRAVRRRYNIERAMTTAGDNGVKVDTTLTSVTIDPITVHPLLRAAFDFGDAAGVAVRTGDGAWRRVDVPSNQLFSTVSIYGTDLTSRELTLASTRTRRGARVRLPEGPIERVWLLCDVREQVARLFVAMAPLELAGKRQASWALELLPLESIEGLPAPPVAESATHRPDVVLVEECMVPIGRLGTWGEYVADPEADDGFAAKLFNTHYEWCMQWRFDEQWFESGAEYKLEMRIKVEKTERDGKAFWAGIYDYGRKKGLGQIDPSTSEIADGYQWYTVATWVPEPNQYIWVGPGTFDKAAAAESAIQAVYVHKFRLTRVR